MSESLNVSHMGFKCNKCLMNPITGIRYSCYICSDLNLCKLCEKSEGLSHNHPLIKIRIPEQE